MKIPRKIKIGKREYKVYHKWLIDWNKKIGGQINCGEGIISIKKTNNEKAKENVFFHEIVHGILDELKFNHPKIMVFKDNESFVEEFGLVLRKTFLDLMEKQK